MKEEDEEEFIDPNQSVLDLDFGGDEIKTIDQLEEQDRAFIRASRFANDITYVRLLWKCNTCGDKVVSYSGIRHQMDVCECGASGVDLEEGYQRNFGSITEISRTLYDNYN